MFSFFKSKPQAPPVVPTDTIVPLTAHDDNFVNRSIVMFFMMRFDDVLDPEMMRSSLESLIERDGWRKLGARLRLNLEYHIPAEFGPKRPAVAYSHVKYDVDIEEHPLGSTVPRATSKPAVVADSSTFREFTRVADEPKSLDDFIYRDRPQIGLRIVSFSNATLVSLHWLHTLFDGMARRELMMAWSAMLAGREGDIKECFAPDANPLKDLGSKPTEGYMLADKVLSTFGMAGFVIRQIWESIFYPEEEMKLVCMPAAHLEKLKSSVKEELAAQSKGDEKVFVSEGDVLFAYMSRAFMQNLPLSPTQTVTLTNAFGLRSVLEGDYLPADKVYLGNAVNSVTTLLTVKDVLTKPLYQTALAIRKSIAEQGTRAQMEARFNLQKEVKIPLVGDASMHMITVSNWTKAGFFDVVDFSAAVVKRGPASEARPDRLGKPSCILGDNSARGFKLRNVGYVVGKDGDGNVWWGGVLRKGIWDKVAQTLKSDF